MSSFSLKASDYITMVSTKGPYITWVCLTNLSMYYSLISYASFGIKGTNTSHICCIKRAIIETIRSIVLMLSKLCWCLKCYRLFRCMSLFLCHSDLLQQISREVAQLASSADFQVAAFLVSFFHHNLKHKVTAVQLNISATVSTWRILTKDSTHSVFTVCDQRDNACCWTKHTAIMQNRLFHVF